MYSINVDWGEDYKNNPDKWSNEGRRLAEEILNDKEHIHHKELLEDLGFDEDTTELESDSFEPMMNYYYPLETKPTDEEIFKVIIETCLTIMYDNDNDSYCLALCGGGMDLSQSIGYAYMLAEKWIPTDLLRDICTQPELSIGEKPYKELMARVKEQLKMEIGRNKEHIKTINKELRTFSKELKERKSKTPKAFQK